MENTDFLNDIYQNAQMGVIGIKDVIYKIKSEVLLKEIDKEKIEYEKVYKKAKKLLKKFDGKEKDVGFLAKISSEFFAQMNLMKDNCDKVIIKMLIEGSYKSIGILTTKLMEYKTCDKKIVDLASKFMDMINSNIKQLKKIDEML